jgi:hypothetical protein
VRGARDGTPASEDTRPWGDLVVRVGRARLTKAALDHWTAVEAVLTYEYKPKRPVPRGVVPDPPAYAACVAYLARLSRGEGEHPAPTRARLKGRCAQQYTSVQRHILDLLIVDYWMREEAAARGVEITAPELSQAQAREFRDQAELRRFLRLTGARASDRRFMVQSKVRLAKLQRSVWPKRKPTADEIDVAIQKLSDELTRKWKPRTSCRPGYVVSECRTYRGSPSG